MRRAVFETHGATRAAHADAIELRILRDERTVVQLRADGAAYILQMQRPASKNVRNDCAVVIVIDANVTVRRIYNNERRACGNVNRHVAATADRDAVVRLRVERWNIKWLARK